MKFNLGQDLYDACMADDLARVEEILAASHPDCLTWRSHGAGYTSLHVAAEVASVEVIRRLIAAGADLDARTGFGDPPIQIAIHFMFDEDSKPSDRYEVGTEIVSLLLQSGANPDVHGAHGCAARGLRFIYGDAEMDRLFGVCKDGCR